MRETFLGARTQETATKFPAKLANRSAHYSIREQIGEGGMGVVYVAEQTEPVQRKVAIKDYQTGDGYQGSHRSL